MDYKKLLRNLFQKVQTKAKYATPKIQQGSQISARQFLQLDALKEV